MTARMNFIIMPTTMQIK